MTYSYVVIGGGIAGTNAAFGIRKHDPEGSILIIGDEPFPVYSRVSLGKVVYGGADPEKLMLKSGSQYDDALIDTQFGKRVAEIDFEHKLLTLGDGSHIGYEKLLIATGGRSRQLTIPGSDLEGVFSFQNMMDAMRSAHYIQDKERVLVIGGGFIGIEFVDVLTRLGKKVTLLVREPWYWSTFLAQEGGELLNQYISEHVEVLYESEAIAFHGKDGVLTQAELSNGETRDFDAVYAGIGIELNHDFITSKKLQKQRGILTNEYMQTSIKDVYAVGDIAEYYDVFSKQYTCGGTWVVASMQGMTVAHNMTHPIQLKAFEMIPTFAPKIPLPVAFVGQCRLTPEMKVEVIHNQDGQYIQANFLNNVLVGAAMIRESALMGRFQTWIKQRMSYDEVMEETRKIL